MTVPNIRELRKKAKLPAKQAGGSTVADFFSANKSAIQAVLPQHIKADRMMKIAMGAMRTTPALMECTTESLFGSVVQCAQLGLEPNTPMGHAYLVPFNRKVKQQGRPDTWVKDVQVIIGYRGLLDLARRSGQIVSIEAHAVKAEDEFDFELGLEHKLVHKPCMTDRGDIIAFYAVAHMKGGGTAFEVMTKNEVDRVMKGSQSQGKYGPWKDHYEEMGRKTVIRRLFKYLPVSIELSTAVAMDEVHDRKGDQHLADVLEGDYTISGQDYKPVDDVQPGEQQDAEPPHPAMRLQKQIISAVSVEALDEITDAVCAAHDMGEIQKEDKDALIKAAGGKAKELQGDYAEGME